MEGRRPQNRQQKVWASDYSYSSRRTKEFGQASTNQSRITDLKFFDVLDSFIQLQTTLSNGGISAGIPVEDGHQVQINMPGDEREPNTRVRVNHIEYELSRSSSTVISLIDGDHAIVHFTLRNNNLLEQAVKVVLPPFTELTTIEFLEGQALRDAFLKYLKQ
jgi:hypothetical protein